MKIITDSKGTVVSPYGDTLSISEAGKAANAEKGGRLAGEGRADGIVIRREAGEYATVQTGH